MIRDRDGEPVNAADVLDGDELEEHRRGLAAARVARRSSPLRPFEAEEHEADVEREYQRIRLFGGV